MLGLGFGLANVRFSIWGSGFCGMGGAGKFMASCLSFMLNPKPERARRRYLNLHPKILNPKPKTLEVWGFWVKHPNRASV